MQIESIECRQSLSFNQVTGGSKDDNGKALRCLHLPKLCLLSTVSLISSRGQLASLDLIHFPPFSAPISKPCYAEE